MFFPKLKDIASTDIVYIEEDRTIREAMDRMFSTQHNCLVVEGKDGYYALSINQVLKSWDTGENPALSVGELSLRRIPTFSKEMNILDALDELEFNFDEILALEENGDVYGILTFTDIITSIDPETFMGNFRLDHILRVTRRIPWLPPETKTHDILREMERTNHSSVILVEEQKPVGIVTSKDMLRILKKGGNLQRPIREYMIRPVLTLPYETTISETLDFLRKHRFKRAVAVDRAGRLMGVFTQKEIVAFTYHRWMQILKEHQNKLDQLNKLLLQQNLEIEKASSLDALTGLYNRMKCHELFISEYTIMLQRHNALTLVLMDLDQFKQINDTYGHNAGDRVLEKVSRVLMEHLRNADIACRWGGDEFVILLPAATLDQAEHIMENLRKKIAGLRFGSPAITLTASFGMVEVNEGETLEAVIERADRALYRAKEEGRDRIVRVEGGRAEA